MEKILADACIFIDIFRGNYKLYLELMENEVVINSIIYMELIRGARDKNELKKIDKYLKGFEMIFIDEKISQEAMMLMKTYSLSHGLLIPDALIAATVISRHISLWSFNKKDFLFIEKINLFHP
jgi:predicted nucleic acid-binding protein